MNIRKINKMVLAKEGFQYPGGRKVEHGPMSGELLRGELKKRLKNHDCVRIDIDGIAGMTLAFTDEAFSSFTNDQIEIVCKDEDLLFIKRRIESDLSRKKMTDAFDLKDEISGSTIRITLPPDNLDMRDEVSTNNVT